MDLLVHFWFTTGNITDQVHKYHNQITPYIAQSTGDQAFFGNNAMFPYEAFTDSWQSLIQFSQQRNAYLQPLLVNENIVTPENP